MLKDYLPSFMQEIKEIDVIMGSEDIDIDELKINIEEVFRDNFFLEAYENGLERYEKILGIVPKLTDTVETRRFRINAKYNETLPYTEVTLHKMMSALCGKNGYKFNVVYDKYLITVRVELTSKALFDEVGKMLKRVLPANLILDLDLLYNQHKTVGKLTHNQLKALSHKDIREEVL